VLVLPASGTDPYAGFSPHAKPGKTAADSLAAHAESQDFVLLTARAIARKMRAREVQAPGTFVGRDHNLPPDELVDKLFATAYNGRPIAAIGEFSMRGGIVDVWPPDEKRPCVSNSWRHD